MTKTAVQYKRVPALDKGFAILALLAEDRDPLGITDIANRLRYNKGTVFNIVYTLTELGILDRTLEGKFRLGETLYLLGRAADGNARLVTKVHPYLEAINRKTHLSAFLGIRSGFKAVIIDKVDSAYDIKIHSEVGMRIPLLAGAGGKALLCQLADEEVDQILSENPLQRFTPNTCVSKKTYREMIKKTREKGIAFDDEEYIEGIRALAVPLPNDRADRQAAIWAVGLKRLLSARSMSSITHYLKDVAGKIQRGLSI